MKKVNYMRIALNGKAYTADSLCTTDKVYTKAEECLKEVQKACTVACLHVRDRKVMYISFGRGPVGATSIHTDSQQTAAEVIAQKVMGKPLDKCSSTSRTAIESLALALLGQVPMSRED